VKSFAQLPPAIAQLRCVFADPGAAVRERGRREGDAVVVELGAELIALAVDAGDDVPS
jgi:hypothetical protein